MARDTQIVSSADHEAPKDYTIPGNAELVLRAVQATFTDNGASGDWLPCVTLITDSGHIIARACDQNVKVTAGDDADVSWFPDVTRASAAAVGNTSLPCAFLDTNTSFTLTPWGGTYSFINWDLFLTNDSTVFSWPFGGNNAVVGIAQPGVYRLVYEYRTTGTDFPAAPGTIISQPFVSTGLFGGTAEVPSVNSTTGSLYRGDQTTGFPYAPISERVFNVTGAVHVAVDIAWQAAAGSATIISAVCFIYRLGDRVV